MKINEVEALVGIPKKNIRFYEDQGLIHPRRNAENGYREYTQQDVQILRQIRLLRKLDVPIGEIRAMFSGIHTLGDGMRRHLISLEREQRNLQRAMELCQELAYQDIPISQLDTQELLNRIEELEQSGTSFSDAQSQDVRSRYIAPVFVTAITVILMGALCFLVLWSACQPTQDAPPMWVALIFACIFAAVALGAVLALAQRLQEIRKGEIDDAKKY